MHERARGYELTMEYDRLFSYAVIGVISGIYFFFNGFNILRKKRLMQNVPTSTVRAIPIGEVEIKGKAKARFLLKTPVSKVQCVFFRYVEEEFRKAGKSYKWVKILDTSSNYPFYLVDNTGAVKIEPAGAELNLVNRYVIREGNLRKTEYYILENEKLYVFGKAKKLPSQYMIENEMVEKRFEEIMNDPEEKIKLDKNQDMWIDDDELASAKEKIKQDIKKRITNSLEEKKDDFVLPHLKDVIIGKDKNSSFIISTMEEDNLVQHLKVQSVLMVYGGAFLIVVCLWIIVRYVNLAALK
ncbi:MAG: E3 ubiquitin ligase family protein [Candidatus Omnitrophica bacterium]|nr:E3 ubiquitin ligase family protein [Candidatus Omnitrophota bacterium]